MPGVDEASRVGHRVPPVTTLSTPAEIVVVDSDPAIREQLPAFLANHGLVAEAVSSAAGLWTRLQQKSCDLMIVELLMPGQDGLSILRSVTARPDPPGFIMFSTLSTETDRVVALELGADDYIAKSASLRELLARTRSVLRRRSPRTAAPARPAEMPVTDDREARLVFDGWVIDRAMRRLISPQQMTMDLSQREFDIMLNFALAPQTVISRSDVAALSGNEDVDRIDRSIDVAISRLRAKLARWSDGEIIRTVRGRGYLFVPETRTP